MLRRREPPGRVGSDLEPPSPHAVRPVGRCDPDVGRGAEPVSARGSLPLFTKARLAVRIAATFLLVHWRLRRVPLPEVVKSFGESGDTGHPKVEARRLSRIVHGTLHVGS